MLGEPYDDDQLPWGVGLIPDWWAEVTPHYTLDFEEIERERRREQARLASLTGHFHGALSPDHLSEDGSLKSSNVGPYSLPGFQSSDGIHDASFQGGTGQPRWYITTDGYFYANEEPDVRYTAAQMVESGYLPDGMENDFEPGWDRIRALSTPVDNAMYARTEQNQWEKPDWLKKKLRSTDGGRLEGKVVTPKRRLHDDDDAQSALSGAPAPAKGNPMPLSPSALAHSAAPSNAWKKKQEEHSDAVPDWKRKREEILKEKAAAAEKIIEAGGTVTSPTASVPATALPVTKDAGVTSTATPATPATQNSIPAWKQKKEESATAAVTTQKSLPPWQKKKEESTSASVPPWKKSPVPVKKETVPAWKKSPVPAQKETVPAWKQKKAEEPTKIPAWKKKPVEDSATKQVPSWKAKQQQQQESQDPSSSSSVPSWKKSPPAKKEIVARPAPIVPSWKAKKEEETNKVEVKVETAPVPAPKPTAAPAPKPTPALAPKPVAAPKPVTAPSPKPTPVPVPVPVPAPRLEPEESEESETEPEEPEVDEEAVKLVSQGLALKLMALPDDSARAKELRNTIAPCKANNHTVVVKPSDLLIAIAHHAQSWKGQEDSKDKIDSLRQVAIIARLVIMKLYGSKSPELKQFEDGLRPAFS